LGKYVIIRADIQKAIVFLICHKCQPAMHTIQSMLFNARRKEILNLEEGNIKFILIIHELCIKNIDIYNNFII